MRATPLPSTHRPRTHTGIIDGLATISTDRNAVVYVWYDNEYGCSCQVLRVMECRSNRLGRLEPQQGLHRP
jgi:glyceraldehyde-3-phosphate dehydrogenase/erythrose-4-phosphate dehydrogenase